MITGSSFPRTNARYLLVALAFGLMAAPAEAHVKPGEAGGFLSGLAHPVSGLDHIIAMVAVGLWGAQLGAPAIWLLPVTFPMMMAFGGFLGLIGAPLPAVEIGIALSGVLLGAAVLLEFKAPLWIAAALVGMFGLYHGHAHGAELPAGQDGLLYSLGFVLATGALHAAGIAIGTVHRWAWGRTALRFAGAGISLGGVAFLVEAL
jgi:urease accessory protein